MKRYSIPFGILLAVVAFFLLNLASGYLLNSRLDLTENNIFTLSEGTRRIVEKIDEPVRMRLYYSESVAQGLGQIQTYSQRIKGLLEQYVGISDGKLRLEIIDPEPFSPEEDQANAYGLQPVPVNNQQLFFGLAVSDSVDNTKVIPFFSVERETFLEYDITSLLYDLANPKKPVVGVISWLPQQQGAQQPVFFQQLAEQFVVNDIETTATSLPDSLDSLLVIHPQADLNDQLAYAIDQYLLNDGKLIVFVDPLSEDRQQGTPASSDLKKLFDAWGVEYSAENIGADINSALQVTMQTAAGTRAVTHPAWLQLGSGAFNSQDPVTANLNQIRMISAGIVSLDASQDAVEFTPLVQTSTRGAPMNKIVAQSADPRSWAAGLKPTGEPLVLAGRYSGQFASAFPDSTSDGHVSESPQSSNLIVIADTDLLLDKYWVEVRNLLGQRLVMRSADNGTMVLNAVDNMVGSSDLISLRSRGIKDRRFEVVSQLRHQAEAEYQEQERTLQQKLRETEDRINQLQQNKQSQDALILSDEQRVEIQKFQRQRLETRKQLRDLQLQLNREIESLGSLLKFLNIVLLPLIILILSFFLPSRLVTRR